MQKIATVANWLLEHAPGASTGSVNAAFGDLAALAAHLELRLANARARWPKIQLGDTAFLERLWPANASADRRAPRTVDALTALHLEDLFLAGACARGDPAALAELELSVLARVPVWVGSFQGVIAEDVQQELRQKLLLGPSAHLNDYAGRGALERWVRVAASRCAIDLQRSTRRSDEGDAVEQLLSGPDPEIDFVKVHDREALRAVLRDAVRELPAQARVLLRLHYLESVSLDRLATLERVHRATIARRLADARAETLSGVRKLLRERLKLTDAEGMSLLRLLESRIDLSLRGAFSVSRSP